MKQKTKLKQTEIGKIPEEWSVAGVKEVSVYINRGVSPKYAENGIPVLNQKCVRDGKLNKINIKFHDKEKNFPEEKKVLPEDLLINSTGVGTLGRVAQVNDKFKDFVADSHLTIVRIDKNKANPAFISFFLRANQSTIENLGEGTSGQQELPRESIRNILIPLPPLPEQRAIAKILSDLDDKIELNNQMNKTLEAIGQAIFKRWFVDFEFPNEQGKPYKSSSGEMVDSELGKIPKGWSVGKYEDLVEISTGKGLKREEFVETGKYAVLGSNGELGRTDNFLFDERLILTGRVGTLGTVYLVRSKFWISDNVLISKPKSDKNYYYSYFTLRKFDFTSLNRGSTQPLITQTDLRNQTVILPENRTLSLFHKICVNLFNRIHQIDSEITDLSQIRDSLLPKLMSGKIRVPVEVRT